MKAEQRHSHEVELSRISLPLVAGTPLYRGDVNEDILLVGRRGLAEEITGGLSHPSRMPCPAWGLSAERCRTGSKLAEVGGSTCESCYATRGHYGLDSVQAKLEKRYEGLFHPLWVPAMVFLIRWECDSHFRWMDVGDLQDENMLRNIMTIARATPDIKHWLPTRELAIVRACKSEVPENLLIRVSATMIDGRPPGGWPWTSTVIEAEEHPWDERVCGALDNEGQCRDCRWCWDHDVRNIAYMLH